MSSEPDAAEAVAAPSRWTPKLMLAGAGAALLLLGVLAGLLVWLWPQPPAKTKPKTRAAQHAAAPAGNAAANVLIAHMEQLHFDALGLQGVFQLGQGGICAAPWMGTTVY